MNHPPRPPKENLFAGRLVPKILITGSIMAMASILTQWWTARQGYDIRTQQTAVFTILCFIQLGNALSVRSMYHSMFSNRWWANKEMWGAIALTVVLQICIVYIPGLQNIFKTNALSWELMKMILALTLGCILCVELLKLVFRPQYHQPGKAV